ncbi:hypothetical protein [Pedobacter chitinilyticus]|nr:hypothetical protein [Pedobacter chitinilyticus]
MEISTDWKFVKVVRDAEPFFINGIGIWQHEWNGIKGLLRYNY